MFQGNRRSTETRPLMIQELTMYSVDKKFISEYRAKYNLDFATFLTFQSIKVLYEPVVEKMEWNIR
jgi:hypothetical protein